MTTSQLDVSLNTSKKSLFCNHCMYDSGNYENMKEHYKSDFHKYNLNRVTNNLNPLNFQEFIAKKEAFIKMNLVKEEKNKANMINNQLSTICDICKKSFSTINKMNEHLKSKSHIALSKKHEENLKIGNMPKTQPKNNEQELTTLDDISICLFCNIKNTTLEQNIMHMIEVHKLDIPLNSAIKKIKGYIKLLAEKIFKYNACLYCDSQNFINYKALQNHMIDTNHAKINSLDLEEFLFKYYDLSKLLSIKDKFIRKSKEFGIIKIKLLIHEKKKIKKVKEIKEEKNEDDEGWITASDDDNNKNNTEIVDTTGNNKKEKFKTEENLYEKHDSDEEVGPIVLPNGELLLENGVTVGNKMYKVFYKQRYHLKKYDHLSIRLRKIKNKTSLRQKFSQERRTKPKFNVLSGSNKSSFIRINTLFKARKQVNV